jgi:hypothetical protein
MEDPNINSLGERFTKVFRLQTSPIAVYGAEEVPSEAVALSTIHRCLAAAMYRVATEEDSPAVYLEGSMEGCCPGGLSYTGFIRRPDYVNWFVSTGKADVQDGVAEFLKASPDLVEKSFAAIGQITSLGRYLVFQRCDRVLKPDPGVRAICCIGNAEQVRNIAAMVHFDRIDPFYPVIVPWGPACATMITYPAGLAEHAPPDTAFLGPQDPTLNWALPPDTMAIGLPIGLARRMAALFDQAFITKRPTVAFPRHR